MINKLKRYEYVILGAMKSVYGDFTVPNADDIGPVYNGSNSGIMKLYGIHGLGCLPYIHNYNF